MLPSLYDVGNRDRLAVSCQKPVKKLNPSVIMAHYVTIISLRIKKNSGAGFLTRRNMKKSFSRTAMLSGVPIRQKNFMVLTAFLSISNLTNLK